MCCHVECLSLEGLSRLIFAKEIEVTELCFFFFFPLIFTQLPLPYYLLLYISSCCFCLPFKFCCYASAKTQGKCLYSGNLCLRLQHLLHSTHWLTPCMMCSTAVHQHFLLGTVPFHSTLNSSYLCRCQNLHGLKI